MSGTACSCSTDASTIAVIVRRWRASVAAAFSPTCRIPSAYTSRDRSFCLGALDLRVTLRPTLPSFLGTARSERGSRGVTTRFSSCEASQRIQVGEVADEPLLDQLIDQRLAKPLDVHGAARGEVLEAPAQPGRTRRVLAPPDDFFLVARRARCRTPCTSSASPRASSRAAAARAPARRRWG